MPHATLTDLDWAHADLWGAPVRRPRRPLGPRDLLWALLALVAVNVAAAVPSLVLMARNPSADLSTFAYSNGMLATGMVALWLVFVGWPLLASRLHGAGRLSVDFGWACTARDAWTGAALGLGLRAVDTGLSALIAHVGAFGQDANNSAWLFLPRHWAWQVAFVLGATVLAPTFEELFFRGFTLRALTAWKRPSPKMRNAIGIVGSSLLFGLLHTTGWSLGGLYVMVVTGSLGAVLAVVAVHTGRLGRGIWAHIVFNASGVLLAYLAS